MTIGPFLARLVFSALAVTVLVSGPRPLGAVAAEEQAAVASHTGHRERSGEFIRIAREATKQYHNPQAAVEAGYVETFGCVSADEEGAMGVHMINFAKVQDPALNPADPELLIYEPTGNGGLRLTGVDYLVFADAWHGANGAAPPELLGQLFHLFDSPNRFGLGAFYTLHVWAWKENPNGAFVNWHPNVSCTGFNPM